MGNRVALHNLGCKVNAYEIEAGFQSIFSVIHIEISLSVQHKVDGVISPDTRAVGLFRRTFFPSAGNKMKFF